MTEEPEDTDDDEWYCWEEKEWCENRLFYEYDLEHLEELPTKGKM